MNFTCKECNDTGSRDKSGNYLDCGHCDAAMQRKAMNDFLDKLPAMGDYDAAWLVHQRALAMAPKQVSITAAKKVIEAWDATGAYPDTFTERQAVHTAVRELELSIAAPAVANGALTDEQINEVAIDYASHVAGDVYDVTKYDYPEDFFNCVRAILAAVGPDAALVKALTKCVQAIADTPMSYNSELGEARRMALATLSSAKGN